MARSILNYGETDTYKTSNAREFARWLTRRYSLPVAWICGDSGWGPAQDDVDAGTIHPLSLRSCKYPVAVMKQLSRGMWPVDLDVRTGHFTEDDGKGKTSLKQLDWKKPKFCGYVVEGLHENAKIFMQDSEEKGRAIGEPLQGTYHNSELSKATGKPSYNTTYTELGEKLVLRSRATFHHAQVITETYVNEFKSLPVPWVYMSSHQTVGVDDNGRDAFGPAIVGTANVDKITGWFEFSFHSVSQMYAAEVPVTDNSGNIQLVSGEFISPESLTPETKMRTRNVQREGAILWFQKHPDVSNPRMLWHAKLGVPTPVHNRILKRWPDGFLWLMLDEETGEYTQSVATLLEMVEGSTK